MYHIMNRGDRREPIFFHSRDYRLFMRTLGEACIRSSWMIHAYALMPNHFHLVAETPRPNLAHGMQWLLGTYAMRFNCRHELAGHTFGGRYKALPIDTNTPGYFRTACNYVHLNPVRAGLIHSDQPLKCYQWSSFCDYLSPPHARPAWLSVTRLLGEYGFSDDSPDDRHAFELIMEGQREQKDPSYDTLRSGWSFGEVQFRKELVQLMDPSKVHGRGIEEVELGEEIRAERMVTEWMDKLGWTEEALLRHSKSHPNKVRMAQRLRVHTMMKWRWIAQRLQMGHWRTAYNAVRARRGQT